MSGLRRFEVETRLRFRVLASDEDEALRAVSDEVVDKLARTIERLHAVNPRLAAWCLHGDEAVEELEA